MMFMNSDINTKEFEHQDVKFYIRAMDPWGAMRLLGDLQKVIGPIIGKIAGVFTGGSDKKVKVEDIVNSDISSFSVEDIFGCIAENIDGDKLEKYMKRILDSKYIAYKTRDMDDPLKLNDGSITQVFSGNLTGMYKLAWEVLKHNYGDFFSTFSNLSGVVKAQLTNQK